VKKEKKKSKPLELKTLADLTPNPKNPRTITDSALEALEKSITELGDLSSFVFNARSGNLVGGHQRRKVLPANSVIEIKEHYKKPDHQGTVAVGFVVTPDNERYPYRVVDWDKETEIAAMIRANNPAGQFDSGLVADLMKQLESANFDTMLTGFSEKQLVQFLSQANGGIGETIKNKYEVVVECENEKQQQKLYERFIDEGLVTRVVTF